MKIPNFVKNNLFLSAFIVMGIITCGTLAYQIYNTPSLEQTVQTNRTTAQNDVTDAANAEQQAVNSQVTRQTEDGVREKVIQPKLQTAREKSGHSAQKLKVFKQNHDTNKTNFQIPDASRTDNCAELHRQFPDTKFEYCVD